MKRWLLVLLTLVASLSLVFVACGGGGDDDDSSNNDEQSQDDGSNDEEEQDSGDDGSTDDEEDDSDDGNGGQAFSGDEEQYVANVCGALNQYISDALALFGDPENQDATEEEQLVLIEPIITELVESLEDADPPGDVDEFHDEILAVFDDMLERIRAGDVTVFQSDPTEDIATPPPDVQEKYNEIAMGIEECEGTDFFE